LAPVLLILAASQVHGPGESGRAGRDRDPVARHADVETASIPIELDFGGYRHAQEVTGSVSIETVATRAGAAAAVALVRQRAPETRFLPIAARPVPDHPGYFQGNRVDRALTGWSTDCRTPGPAATGWVRSQIHEYRASAGQ